MDYEIREMTIKDYKEVYSLWEKTEGLKLDESDSIDNMEKYLIRNPKLNYIAVANNKIIGTIKCGQDGRRGYLYHLVVEHEYRKYGISKKLYTKCIEELKLQNIWKCNIYVLESNQSGLEYWEHNGWQPLELNFVMLQKDLRKLRPAVSSKKGY
jgi:ribosomal protein S18 acetylase RimI-like enzyme